MRNKRKENLKTIQNKENKTVSIFLAIYKKTFQRDIPIEEFEEGVQELYKLAEKTNPDAKLVRLSEDPKKVIN